MMYRLLVGGRLITISTFPDFSFRDKWSGVFFTNKKVINYLAIKTKWGWISPENAIVEETKANTKEVTFHHDVNEHHISARLAIRTAKRGGLHLEQILMSVDGSEKNILEIGICGRHAYEAECAPTEMLGKAVRAGDLIIAAFPDDANEPVVDDLGARMQQQGDENYAIRVIQVPFKKSVTIDVRHSPPRFAAVTSAKSAAFSTDNETWNELYARAKQTIQILAKRKGWYAGLPWFVQYWARDTFLSLPALVREGYSALARRTLLEFARKIKDGEVPRLIREDGTPEYGSIDANPLFMNAVADYVRATGDYTILNELRAEIHEALGWILDNARGYFLRSRGKDTWMDTLEIRKNPVEVAAYTTNGVRKLAQLGVLPGELYKDIMDEWAAKRNAFLLERSANVLLASIYGLIPPKEALRLTREWKLITKWGVRTWSPLEPEYDPSAYHTGAAWGLTTAAGLYVALAARDWETAETLKTALLKRGNWTEYLDEVWNSERGEPLGADAQLWSAAMVIRAIDEVIIDKRCVPPNTSRIRRTRLEKAGMRRVAVGK